LSFFGTLPIPIPVVRPSAFLFPASVGVNWFPLLVLFATLFPVELSDDDVDKLPKSFGLTGFIGVVGGGDDQESSSEASE